MTPRRVHRRTILEAPYDAVVDAIRRPAVMQHIARPLVDIRPADPDSFPEYWSESRYRTRLYGFGVLPLGWQDIEVAFAEIEADAHFVGRDRGRGRLIEVWDHRLDVARRDADSCFYADTLDIEAGLLTLPVAASARWLFAHRQKRLRVLARRGFRL